MPAFLVKANLKKIIGDCDEDDDDDDGECDEDDDDGDYGECDEDDARQNNIGCFFGQYGNG